MEATNPIRACFAIACLATLLSGCKSTDTDAIRAREESPDRINVSPSQAETTWQNGHTPKDIADERSRIESQLRERGTLPLVARPQMPSEPAGPLAPLPPSNATNVPPSESKPIIPGSPIVGLPVSNAPAGPTSAVQTGFTVERTEKPTVAKSILPAGEPRIKIVAHVGDKNIVTDEEVWESCRQRMQEYTSLVDGPGGKQLIEDAAKKKTVYTEELRRTIERELILDEMYIKLKKASKAQVIEEIKEFAGKAADRQLRDFKKRYRAETDDDFKMILLSQGLTIPVIRRQLERQMMAEEYVRSMLREKNKGIGLSEIREYFDAHPDDFRTADRVKWLSIFISFNKFDTQRAAYDYALAIQQHAAAGEDFVDLSKKYDHGLAGPAGGVGPGTERGKILPMDLEATVWSLNPNQVSTLIETPAGYHIVKVAERDVAGIKPFDDKVQLEVRRRMMRDLQDVEYKRLVEKLWRAGVVQVVAMP